MRDRAQETCADSPVSCLLEGLATGTTSGDTAKKRLSGHPRRCVARGLELAKQSLRALPDALRDQFVPCAEHMFGADSEKDFVRHEVLNAGRSLSVLVATDLRGACGTEQERDVLLQKPGSTAVHSKLRDVTVRHGGVRVLFKVRPLSIIPRRCDVTRVALFHSQVDLGTLGTLVGRSPLGETQEQSLSERQSLPRIDCLSLPE